MSDQAALESQRTLWALGDYPAVARFLRPLSVALLDAVGVAPGDRLLDVGVGDGNTAIEAARRSAIVTGIDLTPRQLDLARTRAAAEGVTIALDEGNAEELPYADGAFDVVVSVVGVIFAPDKVRAAAELARVCRPGGTVGVVSWATAAGFPAIWRRRAASLMPALGDQADDPWGDAEAMAALLTKCGLDVEVTTNDFHWVFPSTVAARDFFMRTAGGFIAFDRAVAAQGRPSAVSSALLAAMDEANESTAGSCLMPSPYHLAVARRPA